MNKQLLKRLVPHLIAIVVFLIVALLFCGPALEGQVLQQHDIVGAKGMAQNAWEYRAQHGHFPLWNTHIFSGMPNYNVAIGGPDILLPETVRNFFLPKPFSFFFIACISFYLLMLSLGINPYIGIFGSLAFAYCTYDPIIIAAGHDTKMMAIAYMPGLLAGLIWLYHKRYWLGLGVTSLYATLEVMANHPQINYYLFIVIICMSITYLVVWIRNKEWKHMGIAFSFALLSALIGVGNMAVIFLTTAEYTKYTMRGGKNIEQTENGNIVEKKTTGLDSDYALSYSIRKSEFLTLLMPKAFGSSSSETFEENEAFINALTDRNIPEPSAQQVAGQLPKYWGGIIEGTAGPVYIGVITFLLFVIGLVIVKTPHRWWILASVLVAILLAWGKYFAGLNIFLLDHLPLYNKFRAPSMALVIPQLVIPVMAAITLNYIFFAVKSDDEVKRDSKYVLYTLGGLVAFIGAVYLFNDYSSQIDEIIIQQAGEESGRTLVAAMKDARQSMFGSGLMRVVGFSILLLVILFLWLKKILSPIIAIIVLTLVNTIDLFALGKKYLNEENFIHPDEYTALNFQPTPADQAILQDKDPHYRVYLLTPGRFASTPATARTMYYHRSVGGYHPAKLRIYQDLIEHQLSKQPLNMSVLNMLNTRYFLISDQQGEEVTNVQRNDEAFGPAWFVQEIKPVNGPAEEMKALDSLNPAQTAVYDRTLQNINAQPNYDPSATISLIKYDNDTIQYKTNSPTNQFAVFSEIYYPGGWNAYIDGNKTDLYKVNYLLRGIQVPAGEHTITFRFEPQSFSTGYKISFWSAIIFYLVLAACVFMEIKSVKKKDDPKTILPNEKGTKPRVV